MPVLRGYRTGNIGDGDAELGHAIRVEPEAHRVIERAKNLRITHAGDAFQFVENIDQRIVVQKNLRASALGRGQRRKEQDVVRALLDIDPILAHHLGQARFGDLDAVIDVNRCHVDIGADLERNGNFKRAVGRRRGAEIDQVIDARKLLFDRPGDGTLQGFCGSARIVCGNDDRRRRDFRILRNRQHHGGDQPGEHDDDGDNRRKNRSVDKEF